MTVAQLTRIFTDINEAGIDFNVWFTPIYKFSYVVLKDNSLLYIGDRDMWYVDSVGGLLYVASALMNTNTNQLEMPELGVVNPDNLDRISTIIDLENINHVVLRYRGEHLGGGR